MTKKKKRSPTGAKKVRREARGPGLSRCGRVTAMARVPTSWSKRHSPFQPPSTGPWLEGERVPSGKSTAAKSAAMATRTWRARPFSGPSPSPSVP